MKPELECPEPTDQIFLKNEAINSKALQQTPMNTHLLLCIAAASCVIALIACKKEGPIIGVQAYALSTHELKSLTEAAAIETDGEAAYRLSKYYAFFEADQVTARKWRERAASQGHPEAMEESKHLNQQQP